MKSGAYSMIERSESQQIAKTILEQIKATDFWALGSWGANNFVAYNEGKQGEIGYILGGIQFSVNAAKVKRAKVIVYLMGNDTYTVRVVKIYGTKITEVAKVQEVYCDDLMTIIDNIIER